MPITGAKIKGLSCFTDEYCGFDEFKLINVIIGRNNTGKSQLLKVVQSLCSPDRAKSRLTASYQFSGTFDKATLQGVFVNAQRSGALGVPSGESDWSFHGERFVDTPVNWIENAHGLVDDLAHNAKESNARGRVFRHVVNESAEIELNKAASRLRAPFVDKFFRHMLADRDIRNEPAATKLELRSDGQGATNIIRDHLIRAENIMLTRRIIQNDLRGALNHIFGPDGSFSSISMQQHGDGEWEIFLEESSKGLVPLSSSGSGLKTVILVLLNLLVIPTLEKKSASDYVFAFEELENNLHPALLRRLLKFIDTFADANRCPIFLTTHSSATLDQFSRSDHAQFVRVSHDGTAATTQTISAHFDHSQVVGDLGARASDILQANGIIWVEGPSDAIYINHWIDLISEGKLLEGRDYACAFYGGSLLARTTFGDPTGPNPEELIQLIRLNRNAALICDSDKSSKGSALKPRVLKAQEEVAKLRDGYMWVTAGKEIETYLPGSVIGSALRLSAVPDDPAQFEIFFPSASKSKKGTSYVEAKLNRANIDKVELALVSREHTTTAIMRGRFDWIVRMRELTDTVQKWNN
ncbi:ATP-binding protein [Xanthomonas sp. NCPPB 2654]|uniref:ATP-dependent nuclease n=1 Tax=unclassified Xanthomonas TaxID=2643310 RepID=UPI0021DF94D0|nr:MULTISPECIES: ATP-binding protein [unclassified Xanthomonas]MDL5365403.1 ATP-binding protein [Xanthomonas sp. NCPPB 2654]UYC20148.1 ATP-binding protein [Xanthomonas sp. CFBP 8443]